MTKAELVEKLSKDAGISKNPSRDDYKNPLPKQSPRPPRKDDNLRLLASGPSHWQKERPEKAGTPRPVRRLKSRPARPLSLPPARI